MLLASIFIGFALYMAPALWRETPQGVFGRALVAFLPLDTKPRGLSGGGGGGDKHLAWFLDYDKAWQEAIRENKLIFIDFTGVNCTNCRANENNVFPLPQVRDELKKYVRVQLYNDFVPDPGLSASASEAQAEQNRAWQDNTFRNVTTPLYAILRPARDKPVLDGKLNGDILAVYADGYINDDQVEKFLAFVKGPQTGQVAQRRDRD
jgi:thiol:disulfide interchange protein DsbD